MTDDEKFYELKAEFAGKMPIDFSSCQVGIDHLIRCMKEFFESAVSYGRETRDEADRPQPL